MDRPILLPQRTSAFSSSLLFMLSAAIVLSYGEQLVLVLAIRQPYLSSELFYLPTLAASVTAVLTVHFSIYAFFCAYRRILRPNFRPEAAVAGAGVPLMVYAACFDFGTLGLDALSQLYGRSEIGGLIGFLAVMVIAVPLIAGLLRFTLSRFSRPDPILKPWAVIVVALLLSSVPAAWVRREVYDSYAALYIAVLIALLLPLVLGLGIYRVVNRLGGPAVLRRARIGFAFSLVLGLASMTRHYGPDEGSGRGLLLATAVALTVAFSLTTIRTNRVGLMIGPPATASLLFLLPLAEQAWLARSAGQPRPGDHVLLFTVDTLRRDALSFYNADAAATPHLDALHADSVIFTHAWSSASWTLPALASIMTGLPPRAHRVESVTRGLPDGPETLAGQFQARGYATEALVFNPLLSRERGLSRGFGRYDCLPVFLPVTTLGHKLVFHLWGDRFDPSASVDGMCRLAARRIKRHRGDQLFFWLHVFDPHDPYEPPARHWPAEVPRGRVYPVARSPVEDPEVRREMRTLYLAEVQYLDEAVGRLRESLRSAGLYENLTIVFTSDHGEEFWEKDRWGHGNPPTETQTRMSLAMKLPRIAGGQQVDTLVSTREVMPLLHTALAEGAQGDERLLSAWAAYFAARDIAGSPQGLYVGSVRQVNTSPQAIVFGEAPHKYFIDEATGAEELYDLSGDPGETDSLAESHPEILKQGRDLFHRHVEEARRMGESLDAAPQIEMSPEVLDELRDLGYIH